MDLDSLEVRAQVAEYNQLVSATENPAYITEYSLGSDSIELKLFAPKVPLGFPNGTVRFTVDNKVDLRRCLGMLLNGCSPKPKPNQLTADQVKWVVNDQADLGVKIGDQIFFFYRGRSLVPSAKYDTGEPRKYRPVGGQEFGDSIHPILQDSDGLIGTLPFYEGHDWFEIPEPTN